MVSYAMPSEGSKVKHCSMMVSYAMPSEGSKVKHCSMMVSYAMPSEGLKVKHIYLRFPALPFMYWDFSGFPESFTILCMLVGERPKFFAILLWEMWFLICLTLTSWNLAQSGFTGKDWNAPFIHKHDTLTYYQFTCLFWTVSKQLNLDIL